MSEERVKIIPLGGLGEIGKNITAIECDDEIVVIDCGVAFPDEEMYGVDLIIPDITYLKNNVEKIKGIFGLFDSCFNRNKYVVSVFCDDKFILCR